jgi:hypothetical protein
VAARWLRERGASLEGWSPLIRFDVASVLGAELQILEDAF